MAGPDLPSGTVTFLFTDIEGSTRLLGEVGQERYGELLAQHQSLLRTIFAEHGGQVVDTQGDSFFVAFRRAREAVAAAAEGQRALAAHEWPYETAVRVRMGLHTGEPVVGEDRYVGLGVHRAARIGAAGHGGQILLSQSTRELLRDDPLPDVRCRDLGPYRLKDLDGRERIYQLEAPGLRADFASLKVERRRRPRIDRRWIPVAIVVVAGAGAAGVLLSRGSSTQAQASAGVAADSVGVFDAESGKRLAEASVRTGPTAVAVGGSSVWVANIDDDSVSRVDPATNREADRIPVGKAPAGVAVGGGFVWVTNSLEGTVSKIDPTSDEVVDTIDVGNGPAGIAYGKGVLWVANSTDRTVVPIDPRSDRPGRAIPAGAGADGVAIGHGSVWVTSESAGMLSRVGPRTGTVIPINVGRGARAVAVGPDAVWVANNLDNTVMRIDPGSNDIQQTIPVGAGPSGLAVTSDGKSVWVSSEQTGMLSRIDTRRNAVARVVNTGNRPQEIALAGDRMYVAVRTSGLAHRGGTLRVLTGDRFDAIDPGIVYGEYSFPAIILTNDGLVAYKRVGGSDGTRLVPDLATSIPSPTDEGRTYTFQVRRGIRYSDGSFVKPADFRRGIERALAAFARGLGEGVYFNSIVGAAACTSTRCDLSRGIVADNASYTVTFHLAKPDPDFLIKLGLPAADAVPASTPLRSGLRVPATGPYMFGRYDPKHNVELVRNPRFREWYPPAQPSGYPDRIRWRFNVKPSAQRRAVERGYADVAGDAGRADSVAFPPPSLLASLRAQFASQLHVNPQLQTFYVFLNTRTPPFNSLKARQAVNYAIDRNQMDDLRGGPYFMRPSCQVLPPGLDGYKRYCPYTNHPRPDGKYTGPDVAKARQLIAESGTKGQQVTVSGIKGIFEPHGGDYFVSVLNSLGYKAHFRNYKDGQTYNSAAGDGRQKLQAGIGNWYVDYPSPANFLTALLSCDALARPISNHFSLNYAEFCDRRIDAEMARARTLQFTDPGTASELWRKIDRDIVGQAPWFFMQNPQAVDFVSRNVGNYQYNPVWGVLLDQLWVK